MKKRKEKKEQSFSKKLLVQETILIWIITFAGLALALTSILVGYVNDFTWLATMVGFPWTAYGVSQAFYYRKSQKENTAGGITYDLAMAQSQCSLNSEEPLGNDGKEEM